MAVFVVCTGHSERVREQALRNLLQLKQSGFVFIQQGCSACVGGLAGGLPGDGLAACCISAVSGMAVTSRPPPHARPELLTTLWIAHCLALILKVSGGISVENEQA